AGGTSPGDNAPCRGRRRRWPAVPRSSGGGRDTRRRRPGRPTPPAQRRGSFSRGDAESRTTLLIKPVSELPDDARRTSWTPLRVSLRGDDTAPPAVDRCFARKSWLAAAASRDASDRDARLSSTIEWQWLHGPHGEITQPTRNSPGRHSRALRNP